jgi:hypothetical protein
MDGARRCLRRDCPKSPAFAFGEEQGTRKAYLAAAGSATRPGQRSFAFRGVTMPRFWQPRFYDFNVWSARKRREKLGYMHRNPVTRGLVKDPQDWVWSSYASYAGRGVPLVTIDFIS